MVHMLLTSLLNLTTVPTSLLTSLNQNKPHYMHIYIYVYIYIYINIILICKIQKHQIYMYIYLIHITLSFYIHEPHIPKKTFKKTSHFTRLPLYPMMTLSVTVQRPEPWSLMSINRTICSAEGKAGVVKEDVFFSFLVKNMEEDTGMSMPPCCLVNRL